ncbi:MAG: two component transcriptional regulator, LuxR family [Chloroflexi bacterium]|jgi:NarL family two-component system response regulator LiaR|nr:two component transcriptional regulator, LuxR family [Chloroflexota bacterium]
MPIKILVVDDHEVVRQGLRMFLSRDKELELVGEAENGSQAIEMARKLSPDVILMDILMPVMDGITAINILRQQLPEIEIVALTSVLEDASIVNAIRAGAIGYLLKDTKGDELRKAIKAAASGQVQLSPQAATRLLNEMRQTETVDVLSPREIDVLRLIAQGQSNKEIAKTLSLGEKTIKTYVSTILTKLNMNSRTQAALYAVKIGLLGVDQVSKELT